MGMKSDQYLARVFGVHPDLVPHIPVLLGDLWSLGVPSDLVVSLLRPLKLPPLRTRVLDLGCGKGAVGIELARELGYRITGIDIFPFFIEEARIRARERGVEDLCSFIQGDIRRRRKGIGFFDAALLISVGETLGGLEKSVERLREMVGPSGKMVIAEGILRKSAGPGTFHGRYLSRREARDRLVSHGDAILAEKMVPEERTAELYGEYIRALGQGADRICKSSPELEECLRDYISRQEKMCEALKKEVVQTLWVLEKDYRR